MKRLPIVAIVGRANVGKSSLFNRIAAKREAIVAKEAGTTRDAVYRKVERNMHTFWIVDTAGLKTAEDPFEATIQEQIVQAADSADTIVVVVQANTVLTDEDRQVAGLALKSKKPVILAVNKVDSIGNFKVDEFKKLGISLIVGTSAVHNQGINELIDKITDNIPKRKARKEDAMSMALIGRPNVGKSHLFNTLVKKQQAIVSAAAGTTRDVNEAVIRYHNKPVRLLDTAGIRRPGKTKGIEHFSVLRTLQAIEKSDICLVLIDALEPSTKLDQKIAGMVKDAGRGLILVVSKWDSIDKDAWTRDRIAPMIRQAFEFTPWAPLVFTSALTGQNVTKLYDLGAQIIAARNHKIKTPELNKWLTKAVSAHPPAGLKNTFPKLRYGVQTDTHPPWFVIYGSDLKLLHWSYKRYLERTFREVFGFEGTPVMFSFREGETK